ncbi:hypothetical protein SAMN05216302_1001284 [Nitrosomonas aestuarii]|uniref:DUF4124 domain-containing protein n=1 Tax=Nitrosomonas aestuarii TaxID=52441 RepID=A0A1I3XI13_9PROT|nr:hypothetical protein [Nitrosomonas aestuarii]SFK18706.1 hypothetical protein SAMN05216302_1001284 [Nitrosomonas aestuarii]
MHKIISFAIILIFSQSTLASLQKCVDDAGMFHYYTHVMPPECQNKTTVEMNEHGVVIRTHAAENKPDIVETAKNKIDAQQQFEEKRRDAVLLNTYTSEEEIDWVLERNVEPIELAISGIEMRLNIAKNQLRILKQQADEAEKSGNPTLASIQQDMIPVKRNVTQLENELIKNHARISSLKEKFAIDRKRFQTLKGQKL